MTEREKKELTEIFGQGIIFDANAEDFTTFKTGGIISAVVFPSNKKEIETLYEFSKNIPVRFIGCGSNLLISDYGYDGILAVTRGISGISYSDQLILSYSGTKISSLLGWCIKNCLSGFEFLAGIPGTIGGALINNAGAKDKSISDTIEMVEYLDTDGNWRNEKKDEILWKYRYSQLKEKAFFVFSSTLKTGGKASEDIIKNTVSTIMRQRKKTQPLEYPSAGSVFKNPPGLFAGRIIEEAGLKGYRIGNAMVSEKHANFIINTGKASSTDIWNLIKLIQETIKTRYNIMFEPEIEFIGRFD